MGARYLITGMLRTYVLLLAHRYEGGTVWGQLVASLMQNQNWKISAGTVYPLLRALTREGLLEPVQGPDGAGRQKHYRLTMKGLEALVEARSFIRTLLMEPVADGDTFTSIVDMYRPGPRKP